MVLEKDSSLYKHVHEVWTEWMSKGNNIDISDLDIKSKFTKCDCSDCSEGIGGYHHLTIKLKEFCIVYESHFGSAALMYGTDFLDESVISLLNLGDKVWARSLV